jgi:hypothetical protein
VLGHVPARVPEQAAAKAVSTQHGHLDLLVNVAGLLHIPGELSPGARHTRWCERALPRYYFCGCCCRGASGLAAMHLRSNLPR